MNDHFINTIRMVDVNKADISAYKAHLGDCVVLTADYKILMQQRPLSSGRFGGCLNLFGGHIESGESVLQGLVRELHEELAAVVDPVDVIHIGSVTEDFTDHTELVHVYFWHDRNHTITGCYEAEAVFYDTIAEAFAHPKIMDYARWALMECRRLGFVT